jgi:hypothetical protein
LRALELIEERGTDRQGGQNDFKKALEDVENVEREMNAKNGPRSSGKKGKGLKDDVEQQVNGVLDLGLVKSDPDKLYPIIYYALKRTLKEWGESMDERPGACHLSPSFIRWCMVMVFTRRTCQTLNTRKIGSCHPSPVGRISQTFIQDPPITSACPHPLPH